MASSETAAIRKPGLVSDSIISSRRLGRRAFGPNRQFDRYAADLEDFVQRDRRLPSLYRVLEGRGTGALPLVLAPKIHPPEARPTEPS